MAGSGRALGGTAEDGLLKGLGFLHASGAGGGGVVVPGLVCSQVALPRPHLVKAAGREFVETHERVGLQRGTVGVSSWVRGRVIPVFHQEILAFKLELGVGLRGVRVDVTE